MTKKSLQDGLSLYWLIVPKTEIRKLKRRGRIVSSGHDNIQKVLSNKKFDYAWENPNHITSITNLAKLCVKDKDRSVLLLSNIDLKHIKQKVNIKVVVYEDEIKEKDIGKIFSL